MKLHSGFPHLINYGVVILVNNRYYHCNTRKEADLFLNYWNFEYKVSAWIFNDL